jgi:hypothetical protein
MRAASAGGMLGYIGRGARTMDLQLDDRDAELLRSILERYLGDFRMEIGKTEDFDMRNDMKKDEARLKAIMSKLGAPVA